MNAVDTRGARTMGPACGIGGAMDSLVIQITMWRDDGTIRARLRSDADGVSDVRFAGSEHEVLALVEQAIEGWTRRGLGDGSS
jgi:hypothetical protein